MNPSSNFQQQQPKPSMSLNKTGGIEKLKKDDIIKVIDSMDPNAPYVPPPTDHGDASLGGIDFGVDE